MRLARLLHARTARRRHRLRGPRRRRHRPPRRVPGGGADERRRAAAGARCAGSRTRRRVPGHPVAEAFGRPASARRPHRGHRRRRAPRSSRPTVEPPSEQRVRHTYTLQLPDAAGLPGLMRAMRDVPGVYDVTRATSRLRPLADRHCSLIDTAHTRVWPGRSALVLPPLKALSLSSAPLLRHPAARSPALVARGPWLLIPRSGTAVRRAGPCCGRRLRRLRARRRRAAGARSRSASATVSSPPRQPRLRRRVRTTSPSTTRGSNTKPLQAVTTIDARATARGWTRAQPRLRARARCAPSRSTARPPRSAAPARTWSSPRPRPVDRGAPAARSPSGTPATRQGRAGRAAGSAPRDGLAMANQADAAHRVFPCNDHPSDKALLHLPRHRAPAAHGRRQRAAAGKVPRRAAAPPGPTGPPTPWPPSWPRSPSAAPPCVHRTGPHGLPVRDVVPSRGPRARWSPG